MILPKNGRVIIIDDESAQVMPLISALSKYSIATTYFDAKKETLPLKKSNDVRVVFLDINLNGGSQPDWNTEKGLLINNITSIIEPQTPFILFVWSVNETGHFEDLKTLFGNELKDYNPIVPLIKMDKNAMFNQEVNDEGIVKWALNHSIEETIELIKQKINEGIKTLDSFEAILKWESVVSDSTTEITNEIVSLALGKGDLNEELKKIYFKLAEAMWGRQLNISDPKEIAGKAVSIFNHLLNDRLEFNVMQNLVFDLIKDIKAPETFSEKDKAIFNSKLLLNFHDKTGAFPGNVYEHTGADLDKPPFNGLIADSLFVSLISSEFYESKNGKKAESNDAIRDYKVANKNDYSSYEKKVRDSVKQKSKFISLEVSPICDFAQKKWKMNRVCPAILWHQDFVNYIGKSDNLYISPVLYINSECFQLVIDLRYFSSTPLETLKNAKPIFSIKHSFLTDIQSLLSRHINRPGITSLN